MGIEQAETQGQRRPQQLNILHLASSLWIGGAEVVIQNLTRGMDPRRFDMTVCHLRERGQIGDELSGEGYQVIGVKQFGARRVDYLSFIKLAKILRTRRISVVHSHTTDGLVDACLSKMLVPGLRVVNTFHFGNYPHLSARYKWLEVIFSRVADRLFAVGRCSAGVFSNCTTFQRVASG